MADRGMLRAGERRGWPGSIRGAHVGRLASLRDPVPAGACRPGRPAPGRQPARGRGKGGENLGLIPITVPEVRRLFLALTGNSEQRRFRLEWSLWRRAHQAVAARCHALRRARGPDRPLVTLAPVPSTSGPGELTDVEWERVRPLLPPQRPPTGRP